MTSSKKLGHYACLNASLHAHSKAEIRIKLKPIGLECGSIFLLYYPLFKIALLVHTESLGLFISLNSVHEIDQDYGMLSLPSLNVPRSSCASMYHEGKIFIILKV